MITSFIVFKVKEKLGTSKVNQAPSLVRNKIVDKNNKRIFLFIFCNKYWKAFILLYTTYRIQGTAI